MTHVLLDRNLEAGKSIRHWLGRWGMTMGEFDSRPSNVQWPSILACDLVILGSGAAEKMAADPVLAEYDSLAPVLLLGVPGSLLLPRDAWQALPQSNPDSNQLRLALQTCLEKSALMRHEAASGQDREEFLSFLGHEMRSPLTATKTALEVLQGDLGGLESDNGVAKPHLKMLEIALRNVRRLHHTVEWSQELMASSPVRQNLQLGPVEGEQLAAALGNKTATHWDPAATHLTVHTDADGLSMVMEQVDRALHYALPHCRPLWSAQCSAETEGALSLTLSPAVGSVQDGAPRVSRLGLASATAKADTSAGELERLLRFVVSGVLVSCLGVKVDVVHPEGNLPGIRIQVPAAKEAVEKYPTVGQLLTLA